MSSQLAARIKQIIETPGHYPRCRKSAQAVELARAAARNGATSGFWQMAYFAGREAGYPQADELMRAGNLEGPSTWERRNSWKVCFRLVLWAYPIRS